MRLMKYEQETIITFNEAEATASVYTHNKSLIHKLEKLAQERLDECRLDKSSRAGQAVDYTIPKAWVKITPSRQITEEQRAIMAERMRANLAAKSPITIED